jgi:hypothetical protein
LKPGVRYNPDDQKGQLKRAAGSHCDGWNEMVINQAINALYTKGLSAEQKAEWYNSTLGALVGIGPKDELEGMMAAQLIASHSAAMECYRRAMAPDIAREIRSENLSQANKLSRTYSTLLEALNRHRGKGQQKVTVEHVHVHEGGQAVVGNISHQGGGGVTKSEDQPHAPEARSITDEPGTEMPSEIEDEREAVPVSGS